MAKNRCRTAIIALLTAGYEGFAITLSYPREPRFTLELPLSPRCNALWVCAE